MKITRVQSFLLSYPFPEPIHLTCHGKKEDLLKRDALLIRIEADNGLVGFAPGAPCQRSHQIISSTIAPFLEGRTLADPDALRVLFMHGPGGDPELSRTYCSVEVALYDLVGKALGVPVSEFLGGRVRDRIRLYGTGGIYASADQYAAEAAAVAERGLSAYKLRSMFGPEGDIEAVRLTREAVGPDLDLMMEARSWWQAPGQNCPFELAMESARALAAHRLSWLEEPFSPLDSGAYARLNASGSVPLAAGDPALAEDSYIDLIQSGGLDYVQMDIVLQGGYPGGRLILTEAAREGLRFAFQSQGTALDLIVAAQLGVCWPEMVAEWLEYPCYSSFDRPGMYAFPLAEDILAEPLQIERGDLVVPRGAGLGVAVNESVIERYPWVASPSEA